jgi:hypothetical protein
MVSMTETRYIFFLVFNKQQEAKLVDPALPVTHVYVLDYATYIFFFFSIFGNTDFGVL